MNTIADEIKYPVGLQSFPEIRERGFLYVDKTQYIYNLIKQKGYYFLSRPRRFGKSLLLSTIEAYYQGRRDLFKGLALDSLTENWEPHPVLHLDLNNGNYTELAGLEEILDMHLKTWEREFEVEGTKENPKASPSIRFSNIIRTACKKSGKKVVILIDEYDKPLLNAVGDEELENDFRSLLKSLYSNLKSMDKYIELGFLTGVARFSKVSIFSDLNNLRDISFEEQFAGICGITSDELDSYFQAGIARLAEKEGTTPQETREMLRLNYDGYHFADVSPDVYNPFSLMNVFAKMRMGSYWFESGTPSYLVRLIEREQWLLRDLAPIEIEANILESAGLLSPDPIPSLYQTGYLTIKDFDRVFRTYTLDYPNREVRDGFISFLVPYYIKPSGQPGQFSVKRFVTALTSGDADSFMKLLESMLAGVPYSEKGSAEAHFQNAAYILFTLMGQYVRIEDRMSDGRIDLTVETSRYVFIFEFKIDSTAEEAMRQIHEKEYWLKHIHSGKEIILIGADFSTKTRRLNGYIIENRRVS
ncbi:MAG: ATP-binding protein [Muribaculaceae bacterium]|nr:ATP-binding protein [Muribaculaceae bacterium]